MFEPPEWFIVEEVDEDLSFFPELSRLNTFSIAGSLGSVERSGSIPEGVERIYEFGSGLGEGLIALDMFSRARTMGDVIGSEKTISDLHIALQVADLLERVIEVEQDGMSGLATRNEELDIVFAHMFGPSYHDEFLPSRFIPTALAALKEGGLIVMNSDQLTMDNVFSWVERNLPPSQTKVLDNEQLPSGLWHLPQLVISK